MGELFQPEVGELLEDLTLTGDRVIKNHIKRGDTITCDDQKLVVTDRIHVADFAARK